MKRTASALVEYPSSGEEEDLQSSKRRYVYFKSKDCKRRNLTNLIQFQEAAAFVLVAGRACTD